MHAVPFSELKVLSILLMKIGYCEEFDNLNDMLK